MGHGRYTIYGVPGGSLGIAYLADDIAGQRMQAPAPAFTISLLFFYFSVLSGSII